MNVAVVSPDRAGYSQTFIRAHVERLPAEVGEVQHLHGGARPLWRDEFTPLPPRSLHVLGRLAGAAAGRDSRVATSFLAGYAPGGLLDRGIARHLRRWGADVILAEYGRTGVAVEPAARRAEVPLVVHFHGWDAYDRSVLEAFGEDYPRLFRSAAAVVAVSHDMMEQLQDLGAPPAKLHRNPCGVDVEQFAGADVAASEPSLLAVGRFAEKKAPHLTLLAFARAADGHPEARLVMAGDGPLLDACRTLARALGVDDRVHFPGAVPHREVRRLMARSRAFVQHSLRPPSGDSEGNPVAVREAMAAGLPVVATRHAGIAETVVHGETGFLVEEHDWEGMAAHVSRLLADPEAAAELGRAGRARAERDFRMEDSIARLADILRAAASGAGAGPDSGARGPSPGGAA